MPRCFCKNFDSVRSFKVTWRAQKSKCKNYGDFWGISLTSFSLQSLFSSVSCVGKERDDSKKGHFLTNSWSHKYNARRCHRKWVSSFSWNDGGGGSKKNRWAQIYVLLVLLTYFTESIGYNLTLFKCLSCACFVGTEKQETSGLVAITHRNLLFFFRGVTSSNLTFWKRF